MGVRDILPDRWMREIEAALIQEFYLLKSEALVGLVGRIAVYYNQRTGIRLLLTNEFATRHVTVRRLMTDQPPVALGTSKNLEELYGKIKGTSEKATTKDV